MSEICIALDSITYKDKWYNIDSEVIVDDKDVNKLIKIGAVRRKVPIKVKKAVDVAIDSVKVIPSKYNTKVAKDEVDKMFVDSYNKEGDLISSYKEKPNKRKYGRRK